MNAMALNEINKAISVYDKSYATRVHYHKCGVVKTSIKPVRDKGLNVPKYKGIIVNREESVIGKVNPKSLRFETVGSNWCRIDKSLDFLIKAKIQFIQKPLGLHTLK